MKSKIWLCLLLSAVVLFAPLNSVIADEDSSTSVGGHSNMYMYDNTEGEFNDKKVQNDSSAGLSNVYLYFSKELKEWLKFDVQFDHAITAKATPTLSAGSFRETSYKEAIGFHQVFAAMRMNNGVEIKAGTFLPMYSYEYATAV